MHRSTAGHNSCPLVCVLPFLAQQGVKGPKHQRQQSGFLRPGSVQDASHMNFTLLPPCLFYLSVTLLTISAGCLLVVTHFAFSLHHCRLIRSYVLGPLKFLTCNIYSCVCPLESSVCLDFPDILKHVFHQALLLWSALCPVPRCPVITHDEWNKLINHYLKFITYFEVRKISCIFFF